MSVSGSVSYNPEVHNAGDTNSTVNVTVAKQGKEWFNLLKEIILTFYYHRILFDPS